jgi:hypothetical protein
MTSTFEVPEAVIPEFPVIVGMPRPAVGDDCAVVDGEGFRIADLPTREVLAVEESGPAGLGLRLL